MEPNKILLRHLENVPTTLNFKSIDDYRTETDGIWHPDALVPILAWRGGESPLDKWKGGYFNPFITSEGMQELRVICFSEPLTGSSHTLSWALHQRGSNATPRTRSNESISSLDTKPHWLTKPHFIAFMNLRAYPHLQLRKICGALRERGLPLDRCETLTLFKQALYHLGDISKDEDGMSLLWRGDGEEGYSILNEELLKCVDELRDSPKNYMRMHLIAEVAVFLAERWTPCRDICRQISASILVWAQDLNVEVGEIIHKRPQAI